MSANKQLGFQLLEEKSVKQFGGAYLKNSNPKTKRPITTSRSMHVVMRSTKATGARSLLRRDRQIKTIIQTQGRKQGIRIYRIANAGNHLHLVVLPSSRKAFHGFIRAISGLIARHALQAERGRPKGLMFWDKRPFTRIVEWGREFRSVCKYVRQNTLEALGFIPYQPRKGSVAMRRLISVKHRQRLSTA